MTGNQPSAVGLRIHHREDPKPYRDRHQTSGSFFADLQGGVAALREAAQNAIDAADGTRIPTLAVDILRLRDGQAAALSCLRADADHWRAAGDGLPLPGHSGKALVISDFGGSGLTGDARAIGTAEAGRLGAFWRASGRSNKTDVGATGGRFGIGKDTFQHASGSRTFVALSRERCGRIRILGQAGLGPRTTPDGRRWTDVSDLGGAIDPATGLTLPLEDREAADVDRLLGLGALRSRHAERHGLPDAGLSIAILDPAPLEEGMTLAQFVAAALGPLLAIGRIRILAGGEEIRPEIFDALGREDGLRFGAAAAVPQELPPLVLEDDWDASIRDWAEAAEADPSRPMAVEAHPADREDLAVRIVLAPRAQGQKTAWYGIRRGAFVLHAPQGRAVDGATVLMDVRGSLISEILAHAEGPSHSRWEMEQARIHRGRSRKSEAEIGLVSRILGLPKTIWSEIRREESQEKAIPMDGFAAGVAALLGPIPTSGRAQTDQGRPGNGGTGDCPSAGGRREERRGDGGGGAPPGAFRVAMAADGRLTIHWNRPDGRLHLVAAPSHRKVPVDLVVSSPDGSGEGRWDRDAGVLEIRRLGSDAVLLEAEGWPSTIALLPKRSVA